MTSEPARTVPSAVVTMNASVGAVDARDGTRHPPFDAPAVALGLEHRDDVLRRVVAEELAELFLVIGDAVPLDERDEIARRVAGERGAAEIGVLRQIAAGLAPVLVKLQRPPPEMRIFSPSL